MKLRMPGKDYTDPGYYFCTLVVNGRRHLLGEVVEWADDKCSEVAVSQLPDRTGEIFPFGHSHPYMGACVAYSPFGQRVARELQNVGEIGQYKGKVEVKGKTVMPDHIHCLLHVKDRLPKPIGAVLNGFIVGCRREWKLMCKIPMKQQEPYVQFKSCADEVRTGRWQLPLGQNRWPLEQADGELRIFEKGYNDQVVYKAGQLNAYYEYMRKNAWRLLMKKRYPNLFTKVWGKELMPGRRFDMIGNMFLLERPWRVPVRISRYATLRRETPEPEHKQEACFSEHKQEACFSGHKQDGYVDGAGMEAYGLGDEYGRTEYVYPKREKSEEEIQMAILPFIEMAKKGAVLVTPCISPAEKAVVKAAYEDGLPVIMFCPSGFSAGYHPSDFHYSACAEGLLLQLAPYSYDPGRKLSKTMCEDLNEMARMLAQRMVTNS